MPESGELIAELIAAEGIDRAVLVGHSTGAQVVAETAARHPELVDSLVLIAPTVNPRERTLAKQTARFLQDIAVLNPKVFGLGHRVVRRGGAALVRPQPAADARAPHRARAARDRRADARGPGRARPHRAPVLGRGGGGAAARRAIRRGARPRARDDGARRRTRGRPHRPACPRRAGRPAGAAARRAAEVRADEHAERTRLVGARLRLRRLAPTRGARRPPPPDGVAHRRCGQARDRAPPRRVRALVVPAPARRRPQRRGPSGGDRARPAPEPAADRRDLRSAGARPRPRAGAAGGRDHRRPQQGRARRQAPAAARRGARRLGCAGSWRSARRSRAPGAPGSSPTRASGPCCRATRRS